MTLGKFITFEGGEGAGKTTQIQLLNDFLKKQGYDVVITREPGGINISEQIREVILNPKNTKMDWKTEALLYSASRNQHLIEKVIPALEQGKIVLCDRYIHSSYAYQGYARGNRLEEVMNINKNFIKPNLVLCLDIDPVIGLQRINDNNREKNRLDMEEIEFYNKVREGYRLFLDDNNFKMINANRSIEKVHNDILYKVLKEIL